MEKRRVAGTRGITIDFGRKLAQVDVEALEPSQGHDRSLAELFSFSSKWSLQVR